jgi:hypothetical protein
MAVGARHARKQEIAALLKLVLRKATNSKCSPVDNNCTGNAKMYHGGGQACQEAGGCCPPQARPTQGL